MKMTCTREFLLTSFQILGVTNRVQEGSGSYPIHKTLTRQSPSKTISSVTLPLLRFQYCCSGDEFLQSRESSIDFFMSIKNMSGDSNSTFQPEAVV